MSATPLDIELTALLNQTKDGIKAIYAKHMAGFFGAVGVTVPGSVAPSATPALSSTPAKKTTPAKKKAAPAAKTSNGVKRDPAVLQELQNSVLAAVKLNPGQGIEVI